MCVLHLYSCCCTYIVTILNAIKLSAHLLVHMALCKAVGLTLLWGAFLVEAMGQIVLVTLTGETSSDRKLHLEVSLSMEK